MYVSSTLLALLLTTPEAEAGRIGKKPISLPAGVTVVVDSYSVLVPTEATSVTAELSSDAGSESVELTESDAWLHGAATIKALPTVDAALTLTLYDEGSAELLTFSGTLGADGSVALTPEKSRADIEALAAELFPNADGGYDLALDLAGADTWDIAYADVRIDEDSTTTTCDKRGCTTTGSTTTSKAEVDFDTLGAVWEGELSLEHEGAIDVDTTSYDLDGKKLDKASVSLAAPWDDGGYGVSTLSADADGTARLAFHRKRRAYHTGRAATWSMTVVSTDWTADTAPTHATVELDGGETLTIPANSYQTTAATVITFAGSPEKEAFQLTIDGVPVKSASTYGKRGVCAFGRCFALSQADDGTWTLSATAYEASAEKLPKSVEVVLTSTLKAAIPKEKSYTLTFEPDVSVVFANEVAVAADPIGVDLAGEVSLLGAADKNGKQKTLSKGDFHGAFTRNEDGELSLAGVDKNDVQPKGDILIGGEPIDFELTDTDKDGVIEAPPVILYRTTGNGKGTRQITTASTNSPGLL